MARIALPDGAGDEGARMWSLRSQLRAAVLAFGAALKANAVLEIAVREAARARIAQINQCQPCQATRVADGEARGLDERFYAGLGDRAQRGDYAPRVALAIGFAERFAQGADAFDDAFWDQARAAFRDDELLELATHCAKWLGLGRLNAVMRIESSCPIRIPA